MRRDATLATAVAGSIGFAIAVGVVSTPRPAQSVSVDTEPVAILVTFTDTNQTLRLSNPKMISDIGMWLDHAFENPRSSFDLRLLPPPTNKLDIEFENGHRTRVYFSGPKLVDARTEFLRRIQQPEDVFVVQYDGASYTTNELPVILATYLENVPRPDDRDLRFELREQARERYRQARAKRREESRPNIETPIELDSDD